MGDLVNASPPRSPSLSPPPPLPPSSSSSPSPPPSCLGQPEITNISYQVWFEESEDELPEPLPTIQDMHNSQRFLTRWSGQLMKRVGSSYVARYGERVTTIEAENMRFVRQSGVMRVPKVYAVYWRRGRGLQGLADMVYIVMEYIEGEPLQSIWRSMPARKKLDVVNRLKASFDKLRSLRNPSGLIESISGGSLQDSMFEDGEPRDLCGPFEGHEQFVSAILAIYRLTYGRRGSHKVDFYESVLHKVLAGGEEQPPVFTHNDLTRSNVRVTPEGELTVVGWAKAGWYPAYWEYGSALYDCRHFEDDWYSYVCKVLDGYPGQYAWLHAIRWDMDMFGK